VASTLARGLLDQGVQILTCVEGRSSRTVDLAKSAGVELSQTPQEVAESSDIILSTVVPAQTVNVAKEVGKTVKGVYVDLNNVSPATV
jgi:3-hydroxyisobutyrate dehydrogenase-like beta-hydroxyacid dehydrogenase